MRCEDVRAALMAGEGNEDVTRHVAGCRECRSVIGGLEAARAKLGDPAFWEEPSPELEDRVVALVAGADRVAARRRQSIARWVGAVAAVAALVLGVVAVLATRTPSPDWEVAILGTGPAESAGGTAQGWNTESGTRVALQVEGLAPAPEGQVYELWFSKESLHISGGTFTRLDGDVEFYVGVARRDYPRVWVTLEPLDDDESPSGVTVLDTNP